LLKLFMHNILESFVPSLCGGMNLAKALDLCGELYFILRRSLSLIRRF
jgi:hypothetical protein